MERLSVFFSIVSLKFWEWYFCGICPSFNKWEGEKPKLYWYRSTEIVPFLFLPSCEAVKFQAVGKQQNTLPGSGIDAYIGKGRNHEGSQLMLPGIHIISKNWVLNQIL